MKGTVERADPNWVGSVVLEDSEISGFQNPQTTHYMMIGSAEIPLGRGTTEVCRGSAITLYELDPITAP